MLFYFHIRGTLSAKDEVNMAAKTVQIGISQNVDASIDGDVLVMRIKLDAPTVNSKSGKSQVIASTGGNQPIVHNGKIIKVGVNVYTA